MKCDGEGQLLILLKSSLDKELYNLMMLKVARASPVLQDMAFSLPAGVKLFRLLQTCNITLVRYNKKDRKNMAVITQQNEQTIETLSRTVDVTQ